MSNNQIIRVFIATAKPGSDQFPDFFIDQALPFMKEQEGLLTAEVGFPMSEDSREYLMITTWEDLDSLKKFAGEQWEQAVIDPREAHLLEKTRVFHYRKVTT